MRRISAPKYFRPNSIISFIDSCRPIFELVDKKEEGFLLDLGKVKDVKLLPVLVVYKIMEYSLTCNCFTNPKVNVNDTMQSAFEKYGFMELFRSVINNPKGLDKEYKNLKINKTDDFIVAPRALLRSERSQRSRKLNDDYLPSIVEYYSSNQKVMHMILQIFSEMLLNFWEHAVDDTKSIIVAHGNNNNIEIACADTGNGIVSTLSPVLDKNMASDQILLESIKKGVTSKKLTNHMGHGLWILDEIVSRTKGNLYLFSEGAYYINEKGRKNSGKCGFWKGTIISASLPLHNPVTLGDFNDNFSDEIKVNWT